MLTEIEYKQPKSLLTPASGYLQGYSHTLNPYAGCVFACSYCYARRMPVALFRQQEWGSWLRVKENADAILAKDLVRAKRKGPLTIFMSSSTDPYQPIEAKERITQRCLEVMLQERPDFLFVQTRSPLVTRDLHLFRQFGRHVMVSMTLETDLEHVRKVFTPQAPSVQARFHALKLLQQAGIPAQAAISPVLPCSDTFGQKLADVVSRVCIDDYFMGDGSKGKRTGQLRLEERYRELGASEWYHPDAYRRVVKQCQDAFKRENILISQAGFLPVGGNEQS
jgi:DNA repair photolyase